MIIFRVISAHLPINLAKQVVRPASTPPPFLAGKTAISLWNKPLRRSSNDDDDARRALFSFSFELLNSPFVPAYRAAQQKSSLRNLF